MQQQNIAFIGAGNMAKSLITGLLAHGYSATKIFVSSPSVEKLQALHQNTAVTVFQDNSLAIAKADIVVFAVKPNTLATVCSQLSSQLQQQKPLVLSIVTGISIQTMETWLGKGLAIIRCMPNTPAIVGSGASALFANSHVSDDDKQQAESILRSVGITLWLDHEAQLHIITALSGSGPAYFFLVMQALQQAAENLGLPQKMARLLTIQTALGAARLALETDHDLVQLRKQVTSPGGTTEKAIEILETANIQKIFADAIIAAKKRSEEISKTYIG